MRNDAALWALRSALASHPQVRDAEAAYLPQVSERPVAWVAADAFVSGPELRQHVRSLVAEAAIPDIVSVLPELPWRDDAGGDRSGQAEKYGPQDWQLALLESAYRFVPPRSPMEHRLADMCAVLLNVHDVGVCDDFIEMGADSTFAITLLTEMQNSYGIELELAEFYQMATIERVAATIEQASGQKSADASKRGNHS